MHAAAVNVGSALVEFGPYASISLIPHTDGEAADKTKTESVECGNFEALAAKDVFAITRNIGSVTLCVSFS